jgi:hypothetical protein
MWVRREVSYALVQPHFEDRIIPLIYQPSDYEQLAWPLSILQMIDFTSSFDEGCAALLRIWGLGYRRGGSNP